MSVQLNFSTQGISLEGASAHFATGWYKFIVAGSEWRKTADNASTMLVLLLRCIEGPMKDSEFAYRLNLAHATSEQAVRIAKSELARVCVVCGKPTGVSMSGELHNIPFQAHITTTEATRRNQDGSESKINNMNLDEVRSIDGRTPKEIMAGAGPGAHAGPPQGSPPQGGPPQSQPPQMGAQPQLGGPPSGPPQQQAWGAPPQGQPQGQPPQQQPQQAGAWTIEPAQPQGGPQSASQGQPGQWGPPPQSNGAAPPQPGTQWGGGPPQGQGGPPPGQWGPPPR